MNIIVSFIFEYFFVYIWLIITTFINIVAPTSGSVIINPVTAFFTDPQRAIGIGAFIFFLTGLHRVYLFRTEILSHKKNIEIIKTLLPYSVAGAIAGGTLISYLNAKALAGIVVVASLYFIYKTIKQIFKITKTNKTNTKYGLIPVAVLSGFFQGGGMPGADIRNNYLRSIVPEISVRAIGSSVGLVVFFVTGFIIFINNHLTNKDIIFIVSVTPFLIVAQVYGKTFLSKMKDKNAKILSIALSLLGITLLTYKYFLKF